MFLLKRIGESQSLENERCQTHVEHFVSSVKQKELKPGTWLGLWTGIGAFGNGHLDRRLWFGLLIQRSHAFVFFAQFANSYDTPWALR